MCVNGNATIDEIDEYVDKWHDGNGEESLSEFLGMTDKEYAVWLMDASALPKIIAAHKQNSTL